MNSVKGTDGKSTDGKRVGDDLNDYPECGIPAEDTRLSNPPCNLRGTGINRWEYLDRNPQEFFEVPFVPETFLYFNLRIYNIHSARW